VDDNSQPIFRLAQVTLPSSPWSYLRLAGFAGLGLAICLIARRALVLIPRRRPNQTRMVDQPPAARVLFELWCEKPESSAFIEAVKLYRTGVWGQPHASLWFLTTFVLYSGVELNHDQAKSVFARLVEEASNDSA
jgi:hypothetical protein